MRSTFLNKFTQKDKDLFLVKAVYGANQSSGDVFSENIALNSDSIESSCEDSIATSCGEISSKIDSIDLQIQQKFTPIFEKSRAGADLSEQDFLELENLCEILRARILEVVSKNGGHLGPSLGAVELILAMYLVFDPKNDPFIFDVSHQSYAHKLLSGRFGAFSTLRSFGGLSGFTKPNESPSDYAISGHSSTSISLALGAAKAIFLNSQDSNNTNERTPVALIGDGAMSAGLAYEALNELGERKYPLVILLNDNEMSIARPIGAISRYLSQIIAGDLVQSIKARLDRALRKIPHATYLAKRFEESIKLITPGLLFEELGLEYIGPVDGHNLKDLLTALRLAKNIKKPIVIHAHTIKGKGYAPAEGKKERWHGVSPFALDSSKKDSIESKTSIESSTKDIESIKKDSMNSSAKTAPKSATAVFSEELMNLANEDSKICGITAAMPSGTGLGDLIAAYPNRFWDVAIAEQHAVCQSAALAKEGYKPFVAIYSTFLQRAFDQIAHDVAISALPVKFAIDRAGIVGEDGETHQGVFDIAFLRILPNFVIFAPRDSSSLKAAIKFAANLNSAPCAFRYPRGSFILDSMAIAPCATSENDLNVEFELGKMQFLLRANKDSMNSQKPQNKEQILLLGYGNGVGRAVQVAQILQKGGIFADVADLRFIKPLDINALKECARLYSKWFIFSDNARFGGVGELLSGCYEICTKSGAKPFIFSFEYADEFIPHGKTSQIEAHLGLNAEQIAQKIISLLQNIID